PCAATARDGVLIARFLGPDAAALRAALTAFLIPFRGAALPRVWAL
ncbi:MAG: urease accessory protein, partial [Rhodobacterales bacterium CG18_big_fil_WC_8_21_14_2_50_71_9]